MSEEGHQDYSSHYRPSDDKEIEETAIKPGYSVEQSGMREEESKHEQRATLAEELDSIEREITQIEQRLADIKQRKSKLNQESEEYIILQDERKILRKNLIDLDYTHKELHRAYKRENQENIKAEQAEIERKIREEHQQKLGEIEKQEQTVAGTDRTKQEPQKEETRRQETHQVKQSKRREERQPQRRQDKETQSKSLEQQLIEARHRARVAAIQAQLATQRLRRSRQIELQAQIIRLRTNYPLYGWWSYFPLSYGLYSAYDLPLYPSYDPLLYPSYLRYPYLGSLYPLSPISRYYRYYPYI